MVVDREAPVVGGLSARREGSEEALGTLLSNGTATKRAAKGEQDGTDGQGSLQVKQQRHLFSAGLLLIGTFLQRISRDIVLIIGLDSLPASALLLCSTVKNISHRGIDPFTSGSR